MTETTAAPGVAPHPAAEAVATLVEQLAGVQAEQAALAERETALKAAIVRLTPAGSHRIGDRKLSITAGRKFDAEAAQRLYPREKFPAFYPSTFDPKVLKANTPPAEVDALMVPTGSVTVKLS